MKRVPRADHPGGRYWLAHQPRSDARLWGISDLRRRSREVRKVPEADLRQWIAEYVCHRLIVLVGVFNG